MRPNDLSAAGLLAIGGMHAGWAAGASWPFPDRAALAGHGTGRAHVPGAGPCLAVAGLLAAAAGLVAGHPRRAPRIQRGGAAGAVTVLAVRGCLGLAGRTDIVAPGSTSAAFRERDRRFYSPLCLALAVTAAPACRA